MPRILVIDDDISTLLGYKAILTSAGHEVATAALGDDGVLFFQRDGVDVVLCDERLPDCRGVDVVSRIHAAHPSTAIVLVSGWLTSELALEARQVGATAVAAKPLIGSELVAVVDHALRLHGSKDDVEAKTIGYAARRWAGLIVNGAYLAVDPRTVELWCRAIAVTPSTLKNRCQGVGVSAKGSLELVRLLRVAIHHAGELWNLQHWLDIVDDRTARALMQRAGFSEGVALVPDVENFLAQQRLVRIPELIDALRAQFPRARPDG